MYNTLKNKDYILLLQGGLVSIAGSVIYQAAMAYWIYETTKSTSAMALITSIGLIIRLFFAPVAGIITDSLKRRNLLVICDILAGLSYLVLGYLAFMNKMTIPIIIFIVVINTTISMLFRPATSSLFTDILAKDVLVRGKSLFEGSASLIDLAGSAMSGILIVRFGVPLLIVLNGFSYILSAISECFIYNYPSHKADVKISATSIMSDMKKILMFSSRDIFLRNSMITAFVVSSCVTGFFSLLVAYVLQNGMTIKDYGYLTSAFSIAGICGMLFLSIVKIKPENQTKILPILYLFSLPIMAAAIFIAKFYVTFILFFVGFFLCSIGNGLLNTLMMLRFPPTYRGGCSGFFSTCFCLGGLLSALVYGYLGEIIPLNILGSIGFLMAMSSTLLLFKIKPEHAMESLDISDVPATDDVLSTDVAGSEDSESKPDGKC